MLIVNNTYDALFVVATTMSSERRVEPNEWLYIEEEKPTDTFAIACDKGSCTFSCPSPLGGIEYHLFGDLKIKDNTTIDGSVAFS